MKTFMTPEAAYSGAAAICRAQSKMFIALVLPILDFDPAVERQ